MPRMTNLLPRIELDDLADDFFDKLEKKTENGIELFHLIRCCTLSRCIIGPPLTLFSRALSSFLYPKLRSIPVKQRARSLVFRTPSSNNR